MTQAHNPPPRVDPAQLADRLRPLLLQLSRQLRREALKSGLSPLDSQLLMALKQTPDIGVSELAQAEHMSRPTMSVHVKRLEAAGWIERRPPQDAADKRRVRLALSEEGQRMLTAVRHSRTDWLVSRLARMAPEELAALDAGIDPLTHLIGF
ncbi:MarR family winged helix-turn-helix transcriptional regulator [Hephaestia sp. GCM10023244]|uniref:MarR family winged helix-turn-helix transcriptional regulator n=1 Tax=unclassified Hephaestia TaxID=2631281 RepID=UPI0020772758|nr:MarR family winged helix-turn-helix transcriptional regulator [Hephaestia sp. MAHUQ-44]MCM8732058.1 MarR family winged helix-turn-helix transcriptional regulator [Hephaestia sp. MAHUQ-44]